MNNLCCTKICTGILCNLFYHYFYLFIIINAIKCSNTAEPYLVPKDKIENKFIVFFKFKKRKKEKNEQKPVLCFNCLLLMRQCPAFVCLFVSKHRKSCCAGSFLLFWFSLAGTRLKIHTSQTCLFLSWTDTCYASHLLHPANNFSYTGTMARDCSALFFVWARSNICTNSLQFSSTFIKKSNIVLGVVQNIQ